MVHDLQETDVNRLIDSNPHISIAHVENIYLWMGRELESIDEASVGSIIGSIHCDRC